MTAQELLDELLDIKEKYGTLDVPISVFHYEDYYTEDRSEIKELDTFEDGDDLHLHSIDINLIS